VIQLLIKVYGLEGTAKERNIEVCSSVDAAPINKTISALTKGINMMEMGTISPYMGRTLCMSAMRGT
jgi:hypothetical protein